MPAPTIILTTPVKHKRSAMELTCEQPQPWAGEIIYFPYYDAYQFQVSSFTGSGPWTPVRSLDGVNWDPCQILDGLQNSFTSVTTSHVNKIFTVQGRAPFALIDSSGNLVVLVGMKCAS